MDKATIIIPNYNGITYLKACLTSIQEGNGKPCVIVVDNGSTDGSADWLQQEWIQEAWEGRLSCIFLSENTGFDYAVNQGIRATKTEYVILLNNDTVIRADFVQQLVECMERHPEAFSAGAKMLNMRQPELLDDAGDYYCALGWAYAAGKDQKENRYQREKKIFAACAGAAIYRMSCLQEIGLFDERHFAYLEDIDIGYRAQLYGYVNLFAPKAVMYHAGSGASGSRHNAFKVSLSSRNSIYLIYKNMPFLQILLNLPFLAVGYVLKILFFIKKGLGREYLTGLGKGFAMCMSKESRSHKVRFLPRRLGACIRIQWQLWLNMFRLFF